MIQFFHWYSPGKGILWKDFGGQVSYLAGLGITDAGHRHLTREEPEAPRWDMMSMICLISENSSSRELFPQNMEQNKTTSGP